MCNLITGTIRGGGRIRVHGGPMKVIFSLGGLAKLVNKHLTQKSKLKQAL
jgi:hypothetical protein